MSTATQLNPSDQRQQQLANQAKTFPWHQIFAASETAAVDFYTKALDWGTEDFDMGPGGIYKMLTNAGSPIAGVVGTQESTMVRSPDCPMANIPPHWSVSIGVDNVDERVKKCEALGGKLLQGPMDIPTVGRIALVEDPQGASFWLFTPVGC